MYWSTFWKCLLFVWWRHIQILFAVMWSHCGGSFNFSYESSNSDAADLYTYLCTVEGRFQEIVLYAQRRIKKVESYLPVNNVFGGIWRSFSGAAYWMVCNNCQESRARWRSPRQHNHNDVLVSSSRRWHNARTAPRKPRLDTSQSYFYDCELHTS